MQVLVERGQLARRTVEVLREVAELVPVGHVDVGVEVAICDLLERLVDAAHRPDQRPRQDGAKGQCDQQAHSRERRHRDRQEPTVRCERLRLVGDQRLRIRDQRVQVVLEHVGDLVLLLDVEPQGFIDAAGFEQVGHLFTRFGVRVFTRST